MHEEEKQWLKEYSKSYQTLKHGIIKNIFSLYIV